MTSKGFPGFSSQNFTENFVIQSAVQRHQDHVEAAEI